MNASTQTIIESTGTPVFSKVVVMESPTCMRLYDCASAFKALLKGSGVHSEVRWLGIDGSMYSQTETTQLKMVQPSEPSGIEDILVDTLLGQKLLGKFDKLSR